MVARWWERLNAHPASRDAVVAAVWLLLGLALLQAGGYHLWRDVVIFDTNGSAFIVILGCMVAVATLRSRRPFVALAIGIVGAGADLLFGGSVGVVLILTDLIYAAMKYGSDRGVRYLLWAAVAGAILLGTGLIVFRPEGNMVPVIVVQWVLIVTVSGAWGWNVRSERLRTHAAMAEQHSRGTRQLRQSIAHDLHDLVANQIAVAGLHIEAAKLLARPAASDVTSLVQSLEQSKRGTDQAYRELRNLITVLTAVDDLEEPVPVQFENELDQLTQLLPAGRSLVWIEGGAGAMKAALHPQPDSCQRIVLRVLQELVSNAAKHGVGDVTVCVTGEQPEPRHSDAWREPTEAVVTLSNARAAHGSTVPGTGLGIGGARLLLAGIGANLMTESGARGEPWRAILTIPTTPSEEQRKWK
ncbi:sensor histidine kinase [Microbacterium sp. A93]|uniref:sensor histidine kinase n=1 Tax=unclassified Microbacterium TaxID=2609290 RepID=UPI003F441EC9